MTNQPATKKFVFSHHPCIDGVASAWAIQKAFPDEEITFQGLDHGKENTQYDGYSNTEIKTATEIIKDTLADQPSGQEVYFVDYVPNDTQVIRDLIEAGHHVKIFDHHQTSQKNVAELQSQYPIDNESADGKQPPLTCHFEDSLSGASLTWRLMHPDTPVPALIKLIEAMDLLTFDKYQDFAEVASEGSKPEDSVDLTKFDMPDTDITITNLGDSKDAKPAEQEDAPPIDIPVIQHNLSSFISDSRLAACYIDGFLNGPDQIENMHNFDALIDEFDRDGLHGFALKGAHQYAEYLPWVEDKLSKAQKIPITTGVTTGDEAEGHHADTKEKTYDANVIEYGDVTIPPRGVMLAVIEEATSAKNPLLLLVDRGMPGMVKLNVRVRPPESENTPEIIQNILRTAGADASKGGGRGSKDQIGQGVCRLSKEEAKKLGINEPIKEIDLDAATYSHTR
ncbi:MAG: hypothetical protein MK052_05930 [Alphaproteobacteria bacterium]|nr:hypothetical protein [Alphaproteobacteria bacterium]